MCKCGDDATDLFLNLRVFPRSFLVVVCLLPACLKIVETRSNLSEVINNGGLLTRVCPALDLS